MFTEPTLIGMVVGMVRLDFDDDEDNEGGVLIKSTLSFNKVPCLPCITIVSSAPLGIGAGHSLVLGEAVSAAHANGCWHTDVGCWSFQGESFEGLKPFGVEGDYIYTGGMLIGRIVMRVWDKAFDPEGRTSSVLVQFRERDQKNLVQLHEWEFRPLTEQEKADTGLPVEAYDSLGYPTLTVVRKW
jgi:hypothetical protein